jgi:hypothetical protein
MFARLIRKLLSPRGPVPQPPAPDQRPVEVAAAPGGGVWFRIPLAGAGARLSEAEALDLAREVRALVLDGRELGELYRRLTAGAGSG